MRFHQFMEWRNGAEKSLSARTHPPLVPFGRLTAEQKALDPVARDMIEDIIIEESAAS